MRLSIGRFRMCGRRSNERYRDAIAWLRSRGREEEARRFELMQRNLAPVKTENQLIADTLVAHNEETRDERVAADRPTNPSAHPYAQSQWLRGDPTSSRLPNKALTALPTARPRAKLRTTF